MATKINYKVFIKDFEDRGFHSVKENPSNNQIIAKKNGVTFIYNPTKNTWGCPQLQVTGKGLNSIEYVANNLAVKVDSVVSNRICSEYSKLNRLQRFLAKPLFALLMKEFEK